MENQFTFKENRPKQYHNEVNEELSNMIYGNVKREQKKGSYTTMRYNSINTVNNAERIQIKTGYEKETEAERLKFAKDLQFMAFPMNYTR